MVFRITFLLLLFVSSVADAQVYRWVDDQGRTHFSDQPREGAKVQSIQSTKSPDTPVVPDHERRRRIDDFLEEKQRERDETNARRAKAEQQASEQARTCKKMRARLVNMQRISTFYRLNEKGEREFVNEAENQRIRERYEAKVAKTCGE